MSWVPSIAKMPVFLFSNSYEMRCKINDKVEVSTHSYQYSDKKYNVNLYIIINNNK